MTIRIDAFDEASEALVEEMIGLRRQVYAGDDDYCPPFEGSLANELTRPAFAGRQRIFLARRNGDAVAYAVARRPEKLRLHEKKAATIGPFESKLDAEAVANLLRAAAHWALDAGSDTVIGPLNGDTWHDYRFNLGPRDEPPYLMEPYNPPYYPQLWTQAGFELLQTYHSRRVDDVESAAKAHRKRWKTAVARGYQIEAMTEQPLDRALDRVYEMVRVIFDGNFLYTPISKNAFKALYDGAEALLEGELSFFLLDRNGNEAGFVFALPDYHRAVTAMKGRKNLWSKAKFLAGRNTDTVNIKTLGVMPDHRGEGLSSAMAYHCYRTLCDEGYEKANICLIQDNNVGSIKLDGGHGRVLRRYGLYQWSVENNR